MFYIRIIFFLFSIYSTCATFVDRPNLKAIKGDLDDVISKINIFTIPKMEEHFKIVFIPTKSNETLSDKAIDNVKLRPGSKSDGVFDPVESSLITPGPIKNMTSNEAPGPGPTKYVTTTEKPGTGPTKYETSRNEKPGPEPKLYETLSNEKPGSGSTSSIEKQGPGPSHYLDEKTILENQEPTKNSTSLIVKTITNTTKNTTTTTITKITTPISLAVLVLGKVEKVMN